MLSSHIMYAKKKIRYNYNIDQRFSHCGSQVNFWWVPKHFLNYIDSKKFILNNSNKVPKITTDFKIITHRM